MTAKLECVLGSERDPSTLLLAAAHTYDLAMEFPDEVLDFAEHVSSKLKPVITTSRRDLRDRRVFTIDGKNAQDLMRLTGMKDYPARKTVSAAGRFSASFYACAAELILETDRGIKTSQDEPERLLEMLILQLAQEAKNA